MTDLGQDLVERLSKEWKQGIIIAKRQGDELIAEALKNNTGLIYTNDSEGDGIAIVSDFHQKQDSLLFSDEEIPLNFFSEESLEPNE